MDAKALLKEAKNALKNKDFQKALKLSKSIIKEDRNNYMAIVLLGLALQEVGPVDNVPKAFKKAIDLNPTNPFAWKALISYYEKLNNDDVKEDLVKAYLSYLAIETDESKLVEYSEKLSQANEFGDIRQISQTLIDISQKCSSEGQIKILQLAAYLLDSFSENDKPLDMYEQCLSMLSETSSIPENFYLSYLTLINKKNLKAKVLEHSIKMHQLFPSNVATLSWICKLFNQAFIEENPEFEFDIAGYVKKLLELDPRNAMGIFTEAVLLFNSNNALLAREKLLEVTTQRPGLVYAWILLTDVLIRLNLMQEATNALVKTQKLIKPLSEPGFMHEKLNYQEVNLLALSTKKEDWEKAVKVFSDKDFNKSKCLPAIIKINLNLDRLTEAEINIAELKSLDKNLAEYFKFCLYKKQRNFTKAKNLIEKSDCNFTEWWIEVGLFHWDLEEFSKSLEPFLKAAKCDPNNHMCFIYLGQYYNKFGQNDKARRCYEKAFKLNSLSAEAGSELSKIYRKQKNWEANLTLLTSLTQGTVDTTNIWAWFQLGLTYLEQGDPVNAMEYLRVVLRLEPENVHCWESLADAYFAKGAFTSSLKCYQKASDLSGFSLYSALQVAYIRKILGEYVEAKEDFENILAKNSDYVPALKGLGETCLCQARECFNDQQHGTARDYAQIASNKVTLAVLQRSELTCLWKLLADCVLFVAKLPDKYSFLKISKTLLGANKSNEFTFLESEELFNVAIKFYCKAVSLSDDDTFLWHDLANCYIRYANHIEDNQKKSQLFDYATAAAEHCTNLSPENWQHWNTLGMVSMLKSLPNYALAQHSFIKAVIAENNSAIAWTNLGILYLLMDDLKLANKAFGEGQRADPSYVNSWIGQGIIAEIMGNSEAMDLFRHSTQLSQHQQGSIGYGHWVCHMLINSPSNDESMQYNIHNMHAIPVAYDTVNWYTEKNPHNGCAWNMLGILAERMDLHETAKKAFKHAYVLAPRKHKDVARTNYGRMLYRTGDYKSAIDMFTNVEAATFSSGGGLALALFRNGQYEESYAAYEQALHWLTEEQTFQSELLVALASMAYKFQGLDGAKTLLFQSIALKPPSPWSLYATLSLSLLHKDLKLAELVLKELVNLETQIEQTKPEYVDYIYHYASLLSYLNSLKNEKRKAVTELSRLVHKHPHIGSTWLILSQVLLRLEDDKHRLHAGAKCAHAALKLGQKNMDASKVLCVAALSYHRAGDLKQATIYAQKAIHYCPNKADGWVTLMSLLIKKQPLNMPKYFFRDLQKYFADIECNNDILAWTKNIMVT